MKIYILTEQYEDYNQHRSNGYFIKAFRDLPTRNDTLELMSDEDHSRLIEHLTNHSFGDFRWFELHREDI